jgi:hypothetical protein
LKKKKKKKKMEEFGLYTNILFTCLFLTLKTPLFGERAPEGLVEMKTHNTKSLPTSPAALRDYLNRCAQAVTSYMLYDLTSDHSFPSLGEMDAI